MLHYNIIACGRDTRDGVRRPHVAVNVRTRKTGSYPPLEFDESGEHTRPRPCR